MDVLSKLILLGLLLTLPAANSLAHDGHHPSKEQKRQAKQERIQRAHEGERRVEDTKTLRLEFDNDAFFSSDNVFTNGWEVQMHYRPARTLADAHMPIGFAKGLAKPFLPRNATDRYYRGAWAVGQLMQTPEDLSAEEVIEDDVPHFGFLGLANTWTAFNDRKFTGFQTLVGVTGSPSLADEAQKTIHEIIGSEEPRGWDNQIDFEPVLNFSYAWKRKFVKSKAFDASVNLDASLGNLFTLGEASIETRFGYNLPGGFLYLPDPFGRSMVVEATLPAPKRTFTFYGSLVARGTGFLRYMGTDGNTFNDDTHNVEWNRLQGQLIAGLHLQKRNWGIHLNFWFSTEVLDEDWANPDVDRNNNFGTFMAEFRFPYVRRSPQH